jgi:CheY-like chemotaxis protein
MAHVLVVDDEPEIVKLVTRILAGRGHTITTARDGQEALDAIAADRPDVVVIDLNLPKLDGLEVTRRLKADPATGDLPVVLMMTRPPTVAEADREASPGPDEYVVKPIVRDVLVRNVERLLVPDAEL